MNIQLTAPKLAFREITYKLKKDTQTAGVVSAKLTVNLANSSIAPRGDIFVYVMPVKVSLDTEDMFFAADCYFKAEIAEVVGADVEEKMSFIETNKELVSSLAAELVRAELNKRMHAVLSMTVTAPAKSVEFWPSEDAGE